MRKLKGLDALREVGAIRGSDPRKISVEWTDESGEDLAVDVWVKPMSFGTALDINEGADRKQLASAIASLVMLEGEDGNPVPMDYKTALTLAPSFAWALLKAVNGAIEPKKKSQPSTS